MLLARRTGTPTLRPTEMLAGDWFDTQFAKMWSDMTRWLEGIGQPSEGAIAFVPPVGIERFDDHYEVHVELPGVDPEDVTVSIRNGLLEISGTKKERRLSEDGTRVLSELRYGTFRRILELPDAVEADHAEAVYRNGVLTVKVPVSEAASKVTVPIKTG